MTELELEALHQTLCCLERLVLPPTPDAHEFFAYDPLPLAMFLPGIQAAAEHLGAGRRRFLDLGCGIGTKLALMHYLGWEAQGVDRHQPYVEVARRLHPEISVEVADIREMESFDADLAYMYRPGVSEETELALERYVVERLRSGSVLFLPIRSPELGLEQIGPHLWVK